ncbi:hypothetical protein DPEC_G00291700 [Dallia pectoralis]|uniref:Uncharacterized protein n=1 Tax=Dallia pectoralis TaxID=75939 RepID=A0ACC2FHU2_DALPE|nr:hypothetical protein DPEC_G00291700 [Dallia pectoralis]
MAPARLPLVRPCPSCRPQSCPWRASPRGDPLPKLQPPLPVSLPLEDDRRSPNHHPTLQDNSQEDLFSSFLKNDHALQSRVEAVPNPGPKTRLGRPMLRPTSADPVRTRAARRTCTTL